MSEIIEAEPIEGPSTELARVMSEGDPDTMLAILEKKAELAPRWNKAINTILITQTYDEDWTTQGDKKCLSSAGAERVARLFSIRFHDHESRKEEFSDAIGKAYRYVYECTASMGDREVFAQGAYSTRDKFLGFAHDEWRPPEDINENNIRNAAYHICIGNAIKALLGLRGIPVARYDEIRKAGGQDAGKGVTVHRAKGTQGGSTATGDDAKHQAELAETCLYIAQGRHTVEYLDGGQTQLAPLAESADASDGEIAEAICEALSAFYDKKTQTDVKGRTNPKQLAGVRLNITLEKARKAKAALDKKFDGGADA